MASDSFTIFTFYEPPEIRTSVIRSTAFRSFPKPLKIIASTWPDLDHEPQ